MMAEKGVCKAIAIPGYRKIFVSLNLKEAKEKIEYAKELYNRFADVTTVPKITVDNQTELGLANGSSLVCMFMPRGRSKSDIDFDEFAHLSNQREVYRASTPILSLGGQLTIGSTVLHSGTYYESIWNADGGKFRKFRRLEIHWWDTPLHCKDVDTARKNAPAMDTETRVYEYGTESLIEVFDNMLLEDFQMEFELVTIDDKTSFLPWDLIVSCTPSGKRELVQYETLNDLLTKTKGKRKFGGFDVGRYIDNAEFNVSVENSETSIQERYTQTFEKESFELQQSVLEDYLEDPDTYLAIDKTGMGEQMSEELLDEYGSDKVMPIHFTNPMKGTLATTLKRYMKKHMVEFSCDRHKNVQMHSIKKSVTQSGNITYLVVTDKTDEAHHHADVFWSRALKCYCHATHVYDGDIEIRSFNPNDNGGPEDE